MQNLSPSADGPVWFQQAQVEPRERINLPQSLELEKVIEDVRVWRPAILGARLPLYFDKRPM